MSRIDNGLAFRFPGQGSQSIGMLSELSEHHPQVAETFREASRALDYDLWEIVSQGPAEQLNSTLYTQPAMLAAGVAAWRVWLTQAPVRPGWMAGHSLGEYTALVCSGSLAFPDALRLVAERARAMQEAVPTGVGAMAAILGLEDEQVVNVCREASDERQQVSAANFNAPGQVVVAGHGEAVARATELAKAAGAKRAVLLPVSVPSHCALMQPAADRFRSLLAATGFSSTEIRVIHNVDGEVHEDPAAIRTALEHQLCGSVQWTASVRRLIESGVDRFVECGPGKVLAGLNKRNAPEARTEMIFDESSLAKAKGLVQ